VRRRSRERVARRDRQKFDCAIWLHKTSSLPKGEFKGEVEKHLTGKETEPWELLYFKLYKSQLPVIEQALETAALMLGTDKSRGYCLEMLRADFLAGANLEEAAPEALLLSLRHIYRLLPQEQQDHLQQEIAGGMCPTQGRSNLEYDSVPKSMKHFANKYSGGIVGVVRTAVPRKAWRCITSNLVAG
jgi:hypothetical protein